MNRRLATPRVGIVKTGQIIMHKACAMDQFQRNRGGVGQIGPIISAGHRDAEQNGGSDSRATRCDGVVQRRGELARCIAALRPRKYSGSGGIQSCDDRHWLSQPGFAGAVWQRCQLKMTPICKSYWTVCPSESTIAS